MKKIISLIFILSLFRISTQAQMGSGGLPRTFDPVYENLNLKSASLNKIDLPYLDNEYLNETENNSYYMSAYGKQVVMEIDIKENSREITTNDGTIWICEFKSPSAKGMEFFFNEFHIPTDSKLFIYNNEGNQILGAYNNFNNPDSSNTSPVAFNTEPIKGDNIFIEYFEPFNPEFEGTLVLSSVTHIFNSTVFGNSDEEPEIAPCHLDVGCMDYKGFASFDKESSSVCNIFITKDNIRFSGTGVLLNNTARDGTPYLLTARHIQSSEWPSEVEDYNDWSFSFKHQRLGCPGSMIFNDGVSRTIRGAIEKSEDPGKGWTSGDDHERFTADYLLLELKAEPEDLAAMGISYSGWDINGSITTQVFGIHHPGGGYKKFSYTSQPVTIGKAFNMPTTYDYPYQYYYHVRFDEGTIEHGSSGSPLFNNNGKVIGILSMGQAPVDEYGNDDYCDIDNLVAAYGRFNAQYNLGNFSQWLDPNNTYETAIEAYSYEEEVVQPKPNCGPAKKVDLNSVGFLVNGLNIGVIPVCISEPIILCAPDNGNCTNTYFPTVREKKEVWKNLTFDACDNLKAEHTSVAFFNKIARCSAYYKKLYVGMTKCDYNLDELEEEKGEWAYFGKPRYVGDVYYDNDTRFLLRNFDLHNYLPSNVRLQKGDIYKIRIVGANSQAVRYIIVNGGNINISDNIFDNIINVESVNFENTEIYNGIINYSESVTLNSNTTLLSGSIQYETYFQTCAPISPWDWQIISIVEVPGKSGNLNYNTLEEFTEINSVNMTSEIYPNPTNRYVNLCNLELKDESNIKVRIYNTQGKLVKYLNLANVNEKIDLVDLPNGLYLLEIFSNTGIFKIKSLKIN